MRNRQRGVTFIGWIVLLIPVAIIVYAGIQLVPKYLTYFAVSRALTQVAKEHAGDQPIAVAALRNSLERRFEVDSIEFPTVNDINFQHQDNGWTAEANYEESVPLFAGIGLTVHFDKTVKIQ